MDDGPMRAKGGELRPFPLRAAPDWTAPPFTIREPGVWRSAIVFSSPHSGRRYPQSLLRRSRLSAHALRGSEDAYVDRLFASAVDYGAPLLCAEFPRAFVDVNRAEEDLDPALIEDAPKLRCGGAARARVNAGLGVVPRIVSSEKPIYEGKLSLTEAQGRLAACYRPYHAALARLIARARRRYGHAILIDCHSMPSELGRAQARQRGVRADIVLGDCFGSSCAPEITEQARALFTSAGFRVALNAPFAGGHVTQRYGQPRQGVHALQIEIDRGLYLDEAKIEPGPQFAQIRAALRSVLCGLAAMRAPQGGRGWLGVKWAGE